MTHIYFYPEFTRKDEFEDIVRRASWYYEPWLDVVSSIQMVSTDPMCREPIPADPRLDGSISAKVPAFLAKATLRSASDISAAAYRTEVENVRNGLLLVWKLPDDEVGVQDIERLCQTFRANGGLSYVLDSDREMSHGCHWLWGSITLASPEERERLHNSSYEVLENFAGGLTKSRGYVLGTGPSLEEANKFDFSDGHCVIANSIVKNRPLMDRLDPVAVTACDPIFHAGPSLYAAEFRQELIEAMDDYPKMFFFAPHRDQKVYLKNLPPRLHHRLVFVPIDTNPATPANYDLLNEFYFVPEGNVLTQMMMPIAASFFEKVSIIGCDGRPLSENSYFWSHHKKSQFNDKMQNIQEVHPAFFAMRDYDDHYSEHCADVARIINSLEKEGNMVESLTDSYVPALRGRYGLDWRRLDGICVVSVNPNLRNNYGHLKAYDDGLKEAVEGLGGQFLVFASKDYQAAKDPALINATDYISPVFSDNVYGSLTRLMPDVDQASVIRFEQEFEAAVIQAKTDRPGVPHAYYLYMGSLPHAIAMANVCACHPDISGSLTTFGECIMDCTENDHINEWAAFLNSIAAQKNFEATAITKQIKQIVSDRCNVEMTLLAHPSASFTDSEFAVWINEMDAKPVPALATKLLSPGGFWGEKNFDLTSDIIRKAAQHNPPYECTVRTGPLESADSDQLRVRENLMAYAQMADGVLDDEQYLGLFSSADIAVLTYRRADWRDRNSSVFVDCLYAGVPMVVSSGTWLGDLVERYGCGIAVDDETCEAYFGAVENIRTNYPAYRAATLKAARTYQSANSFRDVVAGVIAPLWCIEDNNNNYDQETIPKSLGELYTHSIEQRKHLKMPSETTGPQGTSSAAALPVEKTPMRFEMPREADCMFEELEVAKSLFERWGQNPDTAVMIDVGAHSGGSFPPFVDAGWTVYGFEPDPDNRSEIPQRYLDNPRFFIDHRALSDKIEDNVAFFASPESTGISGLSAFRDTHEETARVSTTTLEQAMKDYDMPPVTLLKVDTEGFDLFVMRGMDFGRTKPDIIITEFENNKTLPLGYHFKDQIELLEKAGYTVWVSEWWPIVRYGIRHHWRSLYPAASKLPPEDSWGNFIAFREPPKYRDVYDAMMESINMPHEPSAVPIAESRVHGFKTRIERIDPYDRSVFDQTATAQAAASVPVVNELVKTPANDVKAVTHVQATPPAVRQGPAPAGTRRIVKLAFGLGVIGAICVLALWGAFYHSYTNPDSPLAQWKGALGGVSALALIAAILSVPFLLAFIKRDFIYTALKRGNSTALSLVTSATYLIRRRRRRALGSAILVGGGSVLSAALIGSSLTGQTPLWLSLMVTTLTVLGSIGLIALWSSAALADFVRKTWGTQRTELKDVETRLRDVAMHSAHRNPAPDVEGRFADVDERIAAISAQSVASVSALRSQVGQYSTDHLQEQVGLIRNALEGEISERRRISKTLDDEISERRRMNTVLDGINGEIEGRLAVGQAQVMSSLQQLRQDQSSFKNMMESLVSEEVGDVRDLVTSGLKAEKKSRKKSQKRQFNNVLDGLDQLADALNERLEDHVAASLDREEKMANLLEQVRDEARDEFGEITDIRKRSLAIEHSQRAADESVAALLGDVNLLRDRLARAESGQHSREDEIAADVKRMGERLRKEQSSLRELVDTEIDQKISEYDRRQHNSRAALQSEVMESVQNELSRTRKDIRAQVDQLDEAVNSGDNAARDAAIRQAEDTMKQLESKLINLVEMQGQKLENIHSEVEDGKETLSGALQEVRKMTADVSAQSDEVTRVVKTLANTNVQVDQVAKAASNVGDALQGVESQVKTLDSKLKDAATEATRDSKSLYINFNRTLNDTSIEKLEGWAKTLDVDVSAQAIAYMGHRILSVEDMAIGRLAASVETQILRTIAARSIKQKSLRILEIGTLYGVGLGALYENVQSHFDKVDMSVIDPFEGYYGDNSDPITGERVTRKTFETNLSRFGVPLDQVEIIQHLSESREAMDAANKHKSFNFFFIDGDHSYHGVKRDFENYQHLIPRNGLVVVDDYGTEEYEGINRYIDDTMLKNENLTYLGDDFNTAIFRVKKKAAK